MRLSAIQELRAVAALLVVIHHALTTVRQYSLGDSALDGFGEFYLFGLAGVDIFFVISGFIMMYTLSRRQGRDSWRAFLLRRIKRIVPLYWALTTLLVILILAMPGLFPESQLKLWHTIASYLFLPAENARGHMFPLLVPGWTLTFEMFFYLVFACLLALPMNRIVPALALCFGGFVGAVHLFAPEQRVLVWLANPIIFEFLFGCMVARFCLSERPRPAWLAPVLIAAATALFALTIAVDLWWLPRPLRWGVPAALLVAGLALQPERAEEGGMPRIGMALGDASYSLYLIHPFVLPAVAKLWRVTGLHEQFPVDLYVAFVTVASCIAALVTYRLLEQPLARLLGGAPTGAPGYRLKRRAAAP